MAIRKIITNPNPLLRQKSTEVENIDHEINQLIEDMKETMYAEEGAGLAAIQVAVPKRVMLIDVGKKNNETVSDLIIIINPKILWFSEEKISLPEGCLSFPGGFIHIERPRIIGVKYIDENGKECEDEFTDWRSRAFQHEIDHLDGVTLIDRVSKLKAQMLLEKVRKLASKK